jgi:polysaccharide biosynthesis transport protein
VATVVAVSGKASEMCEQNADLPGTDELEIIGLPAASAARSAPPIGHGAAPAAEAAQAAAYSLADARLVLRRWGWRCAVAGLLCAAISAAIVEWTFVPVYDATAWLEVKSRPVAIAFEQADNSSTFAETQLQMIKSPVVLSHVAAQPEVVKFIEKQHASSALEWLKKGLKAEYVGRSELCEITFRAPQAEAAQRIANAIMDGYLSLHSTNVSEGSKRIVELLHEEKVRRAEEVRIFQDRVRLLTKSATVDDPNLLHKEERIVVEQNPLTGLEQRRTAAEVERTVLEAKLRAIGETGAGGPELADGDVEAALDSRPELNDLKLQLAGVKARLREHRRRSRDPDDPDARRLTHEAREVAALLKKTAVELRPGIEEDLRSRLSSRRRQQILELEDEIEDQRILEGTWQQRIDQQRKRIERSGDKAVDLDFARAELERAQDVFQRISDRAVMLQTEMSAPSRAVPLKRAELPTQSVEIVPYKRLALACLAAYGLPFALAIGWERCTRRIHDGQQLWQEVGLPVLGEISVLPTRRVGHPGRGGARYERDRMTFEESVDALRLGLMLSPELREVRTLAITSAISREGKTSLASALAASLAKATRQPVLLIDGDLRCPSLHDVFDSPLTPGLAEVLAQRRSLRETVVPTPGGSLHFVPAGELKSSPHEILECGQLIALLDGLSDYRYVVIDTPPVLAASEAMIFASAAEATLVCTMRDFSRGPQFRLACQRLSTSGARLVGAVISGLPTRTWASKYGGYGYGWRRDADPVEQPGAIEGPAPRK